MHSLLVLYIDESVVSQIFSYEDCVKTLESGLKSIDFGECRVLPRTKIEIKRQGDFRIMCAHIPDLKVIGTKSGFSVSQFLGNKISAESGESILLYDSGSGELKCIIRAFSINLMRTAAATAIAAKYLANLNSSSVGLYGTGRHSIPQLIGLHTVIKFDDVNVYSPSLRHDEPKKNEFIKRASEQINARFKCCDEPQDAAKSDIIIEATNSQSPVIRASWLHKGTHINSIGTARKGVRIIPDEVLQLCNVLCVPSKAEITSGFLSADVNDPIINRKIDITDFCSLDEVLKRKKKRLNEEDITIFKMIGTPVYDTIIADALYFKALKIGVGVEI